MFVISKNDFMCCCRLLQCTGMDTDFLTAYRYLELMLGSCLNTAVITSGVAVSGHDCNSKQGNNQSKACDSMLLVDLMCVTWVCSFSKCVFVSV